MTVHYFLVMSRLPVVLLPVLCFCRCMFSMWIFVIKTCRDNLCGVFHHVDSQNNFATPSVFLTSSGRIPSPGFSLDVPETFLQRPGAFTLDLHHCLQHVQASYTSRWEGKVMNRQRLSLHSRCLWMCGVTSVWRCTVAGWEVTWWHNILSAYKDI